MSKTYELFASKTFTTADKLAVTSDMATFEDGRSIVAWDAEGATYMQMYDKFGEAIGAATTITATGSEAPSIAILTDGTFAIAYTNYSGDPSNINTFQSSVGVKHFGADGTLLSTTASLGGANSDFIAITPNISATADGGIAASMQVVDRSSGYIRVVSGEFDPTPYNTWSGTFSQPESAIYDHVTDLVTLPQGGYAIARSSLSLVSGTTAYLDLVDAGSIAISDEYQISDSSSGQQTETNLAVAPDGTIFAVWKMISNYGGTDIVGRMINPYTGETSFNRTISVVNSADVGQPNVEVTADGSFLVTWSEGRGGEIYAREVSASGEPIGDELRVTDGEASANDAEYTRSELGNYLDQGMAMIWQTEADSAASYHAQIGWFDILPTLTLLSNGNDTAKGTSDADLVDLGTGKDRYQAGAGEDVITGGANADYIHGGKGNDRLFGDGGADELLGGDGDDELLGGDKADTLIGGQGNDLVLGQFGSDTLKGNNGDDFVFGGNGDDTVFGNAGHDELGGGQGDDLIKGGNGKDQLFGHAGDDRLVGNNGRDLLNGGDGNDVLKGGGSADVFQFGAGNDLIVDFDTTLDRLLLDRDLVGGGAGQADDFMDHAAVVGNNIVFDFGGGHKLTLQGVTNINAIESLIDVF